MTQSFTLFEVIISLVLFSIVIPIIVNIYTTNNNIETYYNLQGIENNYAQSKKVIETKTLQFQTH